MWVDGTPTTAPQKRTPHITCKCVILLGEGALARRRKSRRGTPGRGRVTTETAVRELVRSCQDGDEQAWNELHRRFAPRAFGFMRAKLRSESPEMIKDLCQDLFHRIHSKLPGFRGGTFEAWFLRVASTVRASYFRRTRDPCAAAVECSETLHSGWPLPDQLAANAELERLLARFTNSLSPVERLVWSLLWTREPLPAIGGALAQQGVTLTSNQIRGQIDDLRGRALRSIQYRPPELARNSPLRLLSRHRYTLHHLRERGLSLGAMRAYLGWSTKRLAQELKGLEVDLQRIRRLRSEAATPDRATRDE